MRSPPTVAAVVPLGCAGTVAARLSSGALHRRGDRTLSPAHYGRWCATRHRPRWRGRTLRAYQTLAESVTGCQGDSTGCPREAQVFFCPSPSNWVGSSAGPTPGPGLNSAAAPKGRSTLTSILPRASHTRGHRLASRRTWRGARTQRRSGCCVLRRLRRAFSTTSHTTLLWLRSPACRRSPVPMRSTRRAHSLGAEGLAAGSASGSSPIGCPSHRHVSSSPLAPRCRTAPFDGWRAGRRAIHATGLHSRRSAHSVAALPTPPPGFRTLLACRHQCPRCVALTGARVPGAFATGRNNCCFLSSARGSHTRQATGGIEPPGQRCC